MRDRSVKRDRNFKFYKIGLRATTKGRRWIRDANMQYLTDVVRIIVISMVHLFKELDFNAGLRSEGRFVLDDLDGNPCPIVLVDGINHLSKGSFPEQLLDFITLKPDLSNFHDIIVIFIIESTIESILFREVSLLGVIHLIINIRGKVIRKPR